MFGLNAFALVAFLLVNVSAVSLCRAPSALRERVLRLLSLLLLGLNICRCALSPLLGLGPHIPVEFSTVAYFAVPLILLSGRRSLRSWACYSALMAGFFYYLTMIVAGGPIYSANPSWDVYLSLFCHGTLYFCGLVLIGTSCFSAREGWKLATGTALVVLRALLLRPFVAEAQGLLIYLLLDGRPLRALLPEQALRFALPVYYLVLVGLLLLTMRGFFRQNRKQLLRYQASVAAPPAVARPCGTAL